MYSLLFINIYIYAQNTAVENTAVEYTAVENTAVENTAVENTAHSRLHTPIRYCAQK